MARNCILVFCQPQREELIIYFVGAFVVGDDVLTDEHLGSFLHTAGSSETILLNESRTGDLCGFAFATDGEEKLFLSGRKLIEDVLIGLCI